MKQENDREELKESSREARKNRLHGEHGGEFGLDYDTSFPEDNDSKNNMSGVLGSQFGDRSRRDQKDLEKTGNLMGSDHVMENADHLLDGAKDTMENASHIMDGANRVAENSSKVTDKASKTFENGSHVTDPSSRVTEGASKTAENANRILEGSVFDKNRRH